MEEVGTQVTVSALRNKAVRGKSYREKVHLAGTTQMSIEGE
jgi:hypothetical protein